MKTNAYNDLHVNFKKMMCIAGKSNYKAIAKFGFLAKRSLSLHFERVTSQPLLIITTLFDGK